MNRNRRMEMRRHRHGRRGLGFESLEPRTLLAGDPILSGQSLIISEFVADSTATLLTRTRASVLDPFEGEAESPDWIELLNVSQQRFDLEGMHLTDDPGNPMKWEFPVGTSIDAGAFLVVCASGSDIRDPSLDEHGLLHTNFRLDSGGEYLALTDQDGMVVHEYAPTFPAQRVDVSYSVPMEMRTLVGPDAPIEYLVPRDDSLEPEWRRPGFTDPNLIRDRVNSPVGFDRGGGPAEPGETIGAEPMDRASVDFGRGSIVVLESLPFTEPGRVVEWSFYSEKTSTVTPLILRPAANEFEIVGVGRTRTSDGSGLQTFAFALQSGSDAVDPEGYFFGIKDGDDQTDDPGAIDFGRSDTETVRRYNGPLSGSVRVGQQLSGGRAYGRAFSVQVTTAARLAGPIRANVDSAMSNATSLYVRYPFVADQLDTLQSLTLRVRYDDGFIASLNGTEVARRNVPDTIHFDSTAVSNQPLKDANRFEDINISQFLGALTEGPNVLAVHGINESRASSDFLVDAQLVGVDISSVAGIGFADNPTPGRMNGTVYSGFVSAPSFSHSRGLYDAPFTLELATPDTPDASIYYTEDGTRPTPDNPNATLYQQPLEIDRTTILRAAGYDDALLPSLPQTQSYILPHDVVTQSTLQPAVTEDPVWGPQLPDSLRALPTLSLVTAEPITVEGEIPTSTELIFPDGTEGFQADAGVEVWGGTAVSFPKRSMRLSFKNIYGPTMLEFDVFDDPGGVTQFDQLLLRPGSHDTPFWNGGGDNGPSVYIRNRWANDRQLEMGQPAPRGRFVHLYLNGTYWGQYQLMERPNAAFMASRFGGDGSDYDALNAGTPVDGDDVAWKALLDAVDDGYDAVQRYLDVVNYADYLLLEFFGGNDWDWRPESNWMAARKREPGAGFKFFAWDSDLILRRSPDANNVSFGGPGFLWTLNGGVQQYPEFLKLLAERGQRYFFDGGMFTAESLRRQMDAFVEQLGVSVIAETARWGSGIYTPETWLDAIDWIKETYAPEDGPSRAEIVIEQMRQAGLFPLSDRPQFFVDGQPLEGELVTAGSALTMGAPEGTIYYTLDGSDPWDKPPTVEYTTLIGESAPVRMRIPRDASLQLDWIARDFDDSDWTRGENGIGYDAEDDTEDGTEIKFTGLIGLDVEEQMKGVNATAYVRLPFQVDDPDRFDTLQFSVRYDDAFVAYLNGVEVARRLAPETLAWNARAQQAHANVEAIEFETFNLSRLRHLLEPGQNVLAIHAMNLEPANPDFLITPTLRAGVVTDAGVSPAAIRFTDPISVPADARIKARTVWGDQWSTLREAATPREPFPLRISEIMFHPAAPTDAERSAGFSDADDFEFIELTNISDAPIDLGDVQFVQTTVGDQSEGITFDFSTSAIGQLPPGQHVLVVEDTEAFRVRYGDSLPVAGQWGGRLNNRSETVTLVADNAIVQQFAYQDAWYAQADGQGNSLEVVDVWNTPIGDYGNSRRWQASSEIGGTPGRSSAATPRPGDANGDGQFNQEDLVQVLAAGKYETGEPAAFEQGDWNRDGVFDSHDIVDALIAGDYQPTGGLPFTAMFGTWEDLIDLTMSKSFDEQSKVAHPT